MTPAQSFYNDSDTSKPTSWGMKKAGMKVATDYKELIGIYADSVEDVRTLMLCIKAVARIISKQP